MNDWLRTIIAVVMSFVTAVVIYETGAFSLEIAFGLVAAISVGKLAVVIVNGLTKATDGERFGGWAYETALLLIVALAVRTLPLPALLLGVVIVTGGWLLRDLPTRTKNRLAFDSESNTGLFLGCVATLLVISFLVSKGGASSPYDVLVGLAIVWFGQTALTTLAKIPSFEIPGRELPAAA